MAGAQTNAVSNFEIPNDRRSLTSNRKGPTHSLAQNNSQSITFSLSWAIMCHYVVVSLPPPNIRKKRVGWVGKTSTLSSRERQLPDSSSVVLSFVSYPCATREHSVMLESRVYGKSQQENEL